MGYPWQKYPMSSAQTEGLASISLHGAGRVFAGTFVEDEFDCVERMSASSAALTRRFCSGRSVTYKRNASATASPARPQTMKDIRQPHRCMIHEIKNGVNAPLSPMPSNVKLVPVARCAEPIQ